MAILGLVSYLTRDRLSCPCCCPGSGQTFLWKFPRGFPDCREKRRGKQLGTTRTSGDMPPGAGDQEPETRHVTQTWIRSSVRPSARELSDSYYLPHMLPSDPNAEQTRPVCPPARGYVSFPSGQLQAPTWQDNVISSKGSNTYLRELPSSP